MGYISLEFGKGSRRKQAKLQKLDRKLNIEKLAILRKFLEDDGYFVWGSDEIIHVDTALGSVEFRVVDGRNCLDMLFEVNNEDTKRINKLPLGSLEDAVFRLEEIAILSTYDKYNR